MKKKMFCISLICMILFCTCENIEKTAGTDHAYTSLIEILHERQLVAAIKEKSGKCLLDGAMSAADAQVLMYETYAAYPQITLYYSPKFNLIGYKSDNNVCIGYTLNYLSDNGDKRYKELKQVTSPIINQLKNKSDKEKVSDCKLDKRKSQLYKYYCKYVGRMPIWMFGQRLCNMSWLRRRLLLYDETASRTVQNNSNQNPRL